MKWPWILVAGTCLYGAQLLMLTGCSNPADSKDELLADSVIVLVSDAFSANILVGASLRIIGGQEVTTDSDGIAVFEDISIGRHTVILEMDGYEKVRSSITVQSTDRYEIRVFTYSPDSYVMHRQGVSLQGKVYFADSDGMMIPADTVDLELELPSYFVEPTRTARTTMAGQYRFDSLPELSSYSLHVRSFSRRGAEYSSVEGGITIEGKRAGDSPFVPAVTLSPRVDDELLVVSTNQKSLGAKQKARIVFSSPVDTSLLVFGSIVLVHGGSTIMSVPTWSAGRETLFVSPYGTDWLAGDYGLSLSLTGDNAAFYSGTHQFTITSAVTAPGDVEGLALGGDGRTDYATAQIQLVWEPLSGAQVYDVYTRRRHRDSSWVLAVANVPDTFTSVSTLGAFEEGGIARYMVLGRNEHGRSDPDSASILSVQDNVGPYISPERTLVLKSPTYKTYDNTQGDSPDTIHLYVSLLDSLGRLVESLDTTASPEMVVREGGVGADSTGDGGYALPAEHIAWHWVTRNTGYLETVVPHNNNAAADTFYVDFTEVSDLAGNGAARENGGGVFWYVTE